jgi:hypothetical protein
MNYKFKIIRRRSYKLRLAPTPFYTRGGLIELQIQIHKMRKFKLRLAGENSNLRTMELKIFQVQIVSKIQYFRKGK